MDSGRHRRRGSRRPRRGDPIAGDADIRALVQGVGGDADGQGSGGDGTPLFFPERMESRDPGLRPENWGEIVTALGDGLFERGHGGVGGFEAALCLVGLQCIGFSGLEPPGCELGGLLTCGDVALEDDQAFLVGAEVGVGSGDFRCQGCFHRVERFPRRRRGLRMRPLRCCVVFRTGRSSR